MSGTVHADRGAKEVVRSDAAHAVANAVMDTFSRWLNAPDLDTGVREVLSRHMQEHQGHGRVLSNTCTAVVDSITVAVLDGLKQGMEAVRTASVDSFRNEVDGAPDEDCPFRGGQKRREWYEPGENLGDDSSEDEDEDGEDCAIMASSSGPRHHPTSSSVTERVAKAARNQ